MKLSRICGLLSTGHIFDLTHSRPSAVTPGLNFSARCHGAGVKYLTEHRLFVRAIYIELLHTYMYVHAYIIFCAFLAHKSIK